jgi:hypothetical protein
MARLLHDDSRRRADLCADLRDDCGCDDSSGSHDGCWDRRKRRREIPVGRITLDCTPSTFETPGQVRNVISLSRPRW